MNSCVSLQLTPFQIWGLAVLRASWVGEQILDQATGVGSGESSWAKLDQLINLKDLNFFRGQVRVLKFLFRGRPGGPIVACFLKG